MRPSYFVALRIDDKFCMESIKKCQQKILGQNPQLQKLAIVEEKFHFTLSLLVKDQNDSCENWLQKAVDSFQTACTSFRTSSKSFQSKICLQNVSHFNNRVLYIDVIINDPFLVILTQTDTNGSQFLNELNQHFSTVFSNANLIVFNKKPFQPHMTIAKSTPKHKGYIPKDLFEEFNDINIGTQSFSKLYLCSMLDSPRDDGFYHTLSEFSFDQCL